MTKRPLNQLKFIIVHHSASPKHWTMERLKLIHLARGYHDIGYHYVIENKQKPRLRVGRNINYMGAHTLESKNSTYKYPNYHGIGICIIGKYHLEDPTDILINELAYLIKRIGEKYNIPINKRTIVGHSDIDYTYCPGKNTMKLLYEKLKI